MSISRTHGIHAKSHRLRPRRLIADMLADLASRRAPIDLEMLASMRIALCAAAIWGEAEPGGPLWECVTGLAVIEARHRGEIDMNEKILLTRKDPT